MSRFGDLIRGTSKKSTEDTTSKPSVSEVVESPIIDEDTTNHEYAVEEDVKTFPYESDVSLHDMTKNELEEYGRTVGIELDKRRSKKRLIEDLENYLCQ